LAALVLTLFNHRQELREVVHPRTQEPGVRDLQNPSSRSLTMVSAKCFAAFSRARFSWSK
jgi:hypothetical protein